MITLPKKKLTTQHKLNLGLSQKRRFENPEQREQLRVQMLQKWADPIYREAELKRRATEEARAKQRTNHADFSGCNNPRYGLRHSDATREKMHQAMVGRKPSIEAIIASREYNATHPSNFKGKHHTKQCCLLMSKRQRERLKNPENHPMFGKHHTPEARQKIGANNATPKGESHPNWRGGTSFEPYGLEFNLELKERIRRRDNYFCQLCGVSQLIYTKRLDIHHIDGDKHNNAAINLGSLCHHCHIRVHNPPSNVSLYQLELTIKAQVAELIYQHGLQEASLPIEEIK